MKHTYTSQRQLRKAFWENFPELESHALKWGIKSATQNRHNAETRTAWVDWIDSLEKDGQISESLANRATL